MYSAYKLKIRVTVYSLDILLSWFWTCLLLHVQCCYLTCTQVSQKAGKVVWYPSSLWAHKRNWLGLHWNEWIKKYMFRVFQLLNLSKCLRPLIFFYVILFSYAFYSEIIIRNKGMAGSTVVKKNNNNPPVRRPRRHGFDPWVCKISWRRKWQTTPIFLPGIFHRQRDLAEYGPWGCKELDMTEHVCHILIFLVIFQTLSLLYLLGCFVIRDLWCYYCKKLMTSWRLKDC